MNKVFQKFFPADRIVIKTPWDFFKDLPKDIHRMATAPVVGEPAIPSPFDTYAITRLWLAARWEEQILWAAEARRSQLAFQGELQAAVDRYGVAEAQRRYFGIEPKPRPVPFKQRLANMFDAEAALRSQLACQNGLQSAVDRYGLYEVERRIAQHEALKRLRP